MHTRYVYGLMAPAPLDTTAGRPLPMVPETGEPPEPAAPQLTRIVALHVLAHFFLVLEHPPVSFRSLYSAMATCTRK